MGDIRAEIALAMHILHERPPLYAYKVLRYVTLNEKDKPYPFKDFPKEFELPDTEVIFE